MGVSTWYSYTGFLIKCSILNIQQGSEYAVILEYTRVANVQLGFLICHDRCSTVLWYALDSEFGRVLNMLVLHVVLNKILHHRYLTGLWICLEFWICQCYTGFRRKWPTTFLGFLICQGLNIHRLWICQGYTGLFVNCILKILGILNVLSSEYAKVLNVSKV